MLATRVRKELRSCTLPAVIVNSVLFADLPLFSWTGNAKYYRITGKFGEYYIWRMSLLSQAWLLQMTLRPHFNFVVSMALLTLTLNKVRVVIVNFILIWRSSVKFAKSPSFPVIRYIHLYLASILEDHSLSHLSSSFITLYID